MVDLHSDSLCLPPPPPLRTDFNCKGTSVGVCFVAVSMNLITCIRTYCCCSIVESPVCLKVQQEKKDIPHWRNLPSRFHRKWFFSAKVRKKCSSLAEWSADNCKNSDQYLLIIICKWDKRFWLLSMLQRFFSAVKWKLKWKNV